jgi:hypothetical protein
MLGPLGFIPHRQPTLRIVPGAAPRLPPGDAYASVWLFIGSWRGMQNIFLFCSVQWYCTPHFCLAAAWLFCFVGE